MTEAITVPTDLLEAVARWAAPESENRLYLSQVVVADGELVASDGKRGVRVPIGAHGQMLGIWRADALMAVAAQDAMVQHDRRIELRRRGSRTIGIEPIDGGRLRLHLADGGMPSLVVHACTEEFPLKSMRDIFGAVSSERTLIPDGICFDPKYLAAIDEVKSVITEVQAGGVRVVKWGGPHDPMIFEGPALEGCGPSMMVVMPMRSM